MPARSSGRLLLAGALLAAVLVGCGGGGGERDAAPGPKVRSSGVLLAHPPDWDRVELPAAFRRAGLQSPVALEPDALPTGIPQGEAGMVVGRHALDGATLLPDGLRTLLAPRAGDTASGPGEGDAGREPVGRPVRLGALGAYRFEAEDTPSGFAGVAIYAVPTTRGVIDLVCYARTAAVRFHLEACEKVAAGARITEGRPMPVEPSTAYAAQLHAALDPLNRERGPRVAALRAARTPAAQRAAARGLAAAHRRAVERLKAAPPPLAARAAHGEIVAGVTGIADGYASLARAVGAQDRAAYRAARRAVDAAEDATNRALARLRTLGYIARA
jgi:hypothetical protein